MIVCVYFIIYKINFIVVLYHKLSWEERIQNVSLSLVKSRIFFPALISFYIRSLITHPNSLPRVEETRMPLQLLHFARTFADRERIVRELLPLSYVVQFCKALVRYIHILFSFSIIPRVTLLNSFIETFFGLDDLSFHIPLIITLTSITVISSTNPSISSMHIVQIFSSLFF